MSTIHSENITQAMVTESLGIRFGPRYRLALESEKQERHSRQMAIVKTP
jgi:hypothetical protein